MKFAHLADTHIRNLRYHTEYREVFKTLFKRLRKEKIDYIVHCGDLAHSKTQISPEFVKLCSEFLIGLSSIAPTYLILGNHDGNLKNSSREDAISPIVKALNLPNLFLLKKSGEISVGKEFNFNILSMFDRGNWSVPSNDNRINIALYHGSISNCKTDLGWVMENGEDEITIFEGHDFAFLGDIHKTNQALDKEGRIRYSGSTIQQNFSETNDKGCLVWDIHNKNDFTVKHISIPNPKPFITVELTTDGRIPKDFKCVEGTRLRLTSQNNLSLQAMKRAIDVAEHRFKPERVTYLSKALGKRGNIEKNANKFAIDNLRDISVQEKLIKDFLKDYTLSKKQIQKVFKLNRTYNKTVETSEEVQRNINWRLSNITWDNLFNYGEKNTINFTNLNGIVGIFGKNYSGKSSVIDSLLYILFNSTSKNERKNLNIINQNKQNANGKAIISVGDKEYHIERTSQKYTKKDKGKEVLEAKTNVDFFVKDSTTGEIKELNGNTRNDTDKIIRSYFGTLEDFLLTSMSSQLGALQFISEGSTKRKEILAKFLDLEIFDKKFKLAKKDAIELRGALKRVEDINYNNEISQAKKSLVCLEGETKKQNKLYEKLTMELKGISKEKSKLQIKIDSIPTKIIDITKVIEKIKQKQINIQTFVENIAACDQILVKNDTILKKVERLEQTLSIAEYKEKQEEINQIFTEIENIDRELENTMNLTNVNNKKIDLLDGIPCNNKYPTCKFIKDANDAAQSVFNLKKRVQKLQKEKDEKSNNINDLDEEQVTKHIKQYESVILEKTKYEKEKLKISLEKGKWTNSILIAEKELEALLRKEQQYNENKELIENKESFINELNIVNDRLSVKEMEKDRCQKILLGSYKEHGSLEQQIETFNAKKQELTDLRDEYEACDLFKRCMHPNGITYDIIKKKLPIINEEVGKILANVVDFEVYFEADNKNLNIFIKHHRHHGRSIDMGSGAEKTLAAMAIRLALLSVSSLPKSDIFVLDEPGTALDEDNMDGFISILKLIKTYFKTVILISHLDGLKDCVDQQIVIDRKDGFAHITV